MTNEEIIRMIELKINHGFTYAQIGQELGYSAKAISNKFKALKNHYIVVDKLVLNATESPSTYIQVWDGKVVSPKPAYWKDFYSPKHKEVWYNMLEKNGPEYDVLWGSARDDYGFSDELIRWYIAKGRHE